MEIYTNNAEQRLAGIISNRSTKLSARFGLVFNLTQLDEQHKNEEHLNIALNILRDKLNSCRGEIISFSDGDIFVIYKGNDVEHIKDAVFQMRYLFVDDALAYSSPGVANNNFCTIFDLQQKWSEFVARCQDKLLKGQNDNFSYLAQLNLSPSQLKTELIAVIEAELGDLNMKDYITSHNIWMHSDKNALIPVIKEIQIARGSIQNYLSDKLDILSNPRLTQFFNDILDIKLLVELLSYCQADQKIGYLLRLSTITLGSEEFQLFDSAIGNSFKKNIIIALNIEEVIGDIKGFIEMRDSLRSKGYKLCLNNTTYENFLLLEAEALGFDLIKLKYESTFLQSKEGKMLQYLSTKIKSLKSTHLILTNCDSSAFEFGKKLGIYLFSEQCNL